MISSPAKPAQAPTAERRPNVLLVLTDQQRHDSLGCYGAEFAHTPRLDALSRQGVRFDHCYVNNPICTPSRASLMTGLELPHHGVNRLYDRLGPQHRLFPEHLREAGYRTGLFGKLHVSDYHAEAAARHPHDGFDVYDWCHEPSLALDSPFNGYARYLEQHHPAYLQRLKAVGRDIREVPADCHMSHWAAEATISFIQQTPTDRPFFALLSLFDPHNPYHDHPPGWDEKIDPDRLPQPVGLDEPLADMPEAIQRENRASHLGGFEDYSPEQIRQMRQGYHASVAFLDHQVGRVLDELDRAGQRENTLVIFTSDHGDMLGDHRLLVKGAFFYDPCTRVPLIIRWPGAVPRGSVAHGLAQLHDLPATILHAAGLAEVARQSMPTAVDLRQMIDGRAARPTACCHYLESGVDATGSYFDPPIYASMARTERYKLNAYWTDARCDRVYQGQLFDMHHDPHELDNLWDRPDLEPLRHGLVDQLRQALAGSSGTSTSHSASARAVAADHASTR